MATFSDLKLHHRIFTENYPFSRYEIKDNPIARLEKPIEETSFALITTAGLLEESDKRFSNLIKLGDATFREIPNDVEVRALIEDHGSTSFDHTGIETDRNLAFPLGRFRELEREGKIGTLNHRHFSFMGSIINASPLINDTAPEVARLLKHDRVDAVFLAPV